jgi:hypothetical protein
MKPEIKQALEECRAAFAANQGAKSAWCCHHEILWEILTEPYEKRIAYILSDKPEGEHLVRLHNFRPCARHDVIASCRADYEAKYESLDADYEAKYESLDADYEAKYESLYADYKAKRESLDADYEAKCESLDADYEAKCESLYKNDVPLATWNGKSIFGDK